MKNLIKLLLLFLLSFNYSLNAQLNSADERKFIEVTGSAELFVQPDEIEVEIIIQEYDKNGKRVKLNDIESELYKVLEKNKINKSGLNLESAFYDNWWFWWYYWRSSNYQKRKIKLNLSNETDFLTFLEDLNSNWLESLRITKATNKDIQKYRKEVKIEAIKAAKEKAVYLLESIDEKIGSVLSVEELPENNYTNYWFNQSNLQTSNVAMESVGNDNGVENVTSIKLRYEIKVKFEIL